MPYLVLDPLNGYAGRMMEFLGRHGLEAVAVLTSRRAMLMWEHVWSKRLGEVTAAAYCLEDFGSLKKAARRIGADFPGGFEGIIPWDEGSVLLGSELGELLDAGWNPRRVIERCRDKHVMKSWLRRHARARINASEVVTDAGDALGFQERVGSWPVVVKPTGGGGSEHVYFAESPQELLHCCQLVLEAGSGEVLLEEFVGGREFAVNGLADKDGDFLITDIWLYDKRDSHGVPNLYYQSIKLPTHQYPFRALAEYAAEVVEALELRRSPVHMEVKVDDQGPCLIEVGARLAGGNQPLLASRLHGRSLFELAACHYLAELPLSPREVDFERYDSLEARIVSGIQPWEIPRLEAIHGLDEVSELPSFEGFGLLRRIGGAVPLTVDLGTKSYEVYLMHPDPEQIEEDAEAVRHLLRYEG